MQYERPDFFRNLKTDAGKNRKENFWVAETTEITRYSVMGVLVEMLATHTTDYSYISSIGPLLYVYIHVALCNPTSFRRPTGTFSRRPSPSDVDQFEDLQTPPVMMLNMVMR